MWKIVINFISIMLTEEHQRKELHMITTATWVKFSVCKLELQTTTDKKVFEIRVTKNPVLG